MDNCEAYVHSDNGDLMDLAIALAGRLDERYPGVWKSVSLRWSEPDVMHLRARRDDGNKFQGLLRKPEGRPWDWLDELERTMACTTDGASAEREGGN